MASVKVVNKEQGRCVHNCANARLCSFTNFLKPTRSHRNVPAISSPRSLTLNTQVPYMPKRRKPVFC